MQERTKYFLFFMGGVAVGAALPIVAPAVVEGGRPLVKALLKHTALAIERLQATAGRAVEWFDDLLAEVRSEWTPSHAPTELTIVPSEPVMDKRELS